MAAEDVPHFGLVALARLESSMVRTLLRSVERVAACKRQAIEQSPVANDPALMR
jgi:hypothetical protein